MLGSLHLEVMCPALEEAFVGTSDLEGIEALEGAPSDLRLDLQRLSTAAFQALVELHSALELLFERDLLDEKYYELPLQHLQ